MTNLPEYGPSNTTAEGPKVELEIKSGKFKDIRFTLEGMKFAEEENPDGTINMSYDYDITSGQELSEEDTKEFQQMTGDIIIDILTKQVEKGEVVYHGGSDEKA